MRFWWLPVVSLALVACTQMPTRRKISQKSRAMHAASLIGTIVLLGWNAAAGAADYVEMSGQELYVRFCASCHGATGRGDGPVADSFKVEVPDLTLIARRAKGAYSRDRIERVIDGRHIIAAHGTRTMPVWGEELSRAELGNPDAERSTRLIILRLADYVWLLQRPAPETRDNDE